MRITKIYLTSFFLTLLLLGGSLRAVFKYLPAPWLVAGVMLGGGFFGYAFLLSRTAESPIRRFLFKKPLWLCSFFLAAVVAACFFIYPLADARKKTGAGSTADDALIQAAQAFFTGRMYAETLPRGTPISPGPGWVLLNLPFANSHWYSLMAPAYIVLALIIFSKSLDAGHHALAPGESPGANDARLSASARSALILLLLSTSLLFWELLVTGHDLVALGFAFPAVTLLTWKLSNNSPLPLGEGQGVRADLPRSLTISSLGKLIGPLLLGLLAGLIATARVLFAPFPLLLVLLAWKSNRKVALLVGGVGTLTVALLHGCFFYTSANYQPLHLFSRGTSHVGWPLIALGLAVEIPAVLYTFLRADRRPASWLHGLWLCLFIPLLLISLGELRSEAFHFARWEAANYFFPCIPVYLFYAVGEPNPSADRLP